MRKSTELNTRILRIRTPAAHPFALPCVVALSLPAAACAPDAPAGSRPDVVVDTIGDTIVVRTNSGSVWGAEATLVPEVSIGEVDGPEEYLFGAVASIAVDDDHNVYVLDWQAQEIRQYDALGDYVRRLARRGEGPGELATADRMAYLPDGRLVVPDVRNGRLNLFGPGANDREQWPLQDYYPSGRGLRTEQVPFSPEALWAGHPHGGIVKGISSDYRIDLQLGDRVLRVERTVDPIPVSPAERDHYRNSITEDLRHTVPDWEWDGPPIPETKPVFKRLHSGRDGRIWVELSSELKDVSNPSLGERVRFDIFEPD